MVEIHREIDRKDWNLTENLARARYKKEFEYPPYSAILNTKSNPLLVFYDIGAQVKYVFDYDQEDLGWLIHANHSSNLFAWDYQGLTDQEFFDLKVHLMDERDPKVLAPTKKQQEGLIGWEFDMPKIGPVVIVLIKDKDENEQQRVIVRKKSDIGKMT
ncbi:MAG: hypothetical protein NTV48_02160 [Candidatus Vogelbacteria bacterium]|nr:hypothetical protein [Candidatus Vogelbacteria bacterium]